MRISVLLLSCAGIVSSQALAGDKQTGCFGDQGDGSFRNPVIAADYSDPDVIRVGNDYYMVTSTFQFAPGVQVLQSHDLVNWKTIGAAFSDVSKIGPDYNWDRMSLYGQGVYAPSIRYHDGKFWVFVNCHGVGGFYCCTATNAAGPWTATQIMDRNGKPLRTHGWTDPCPFWDDNGKAYLSSSHPSSRWYGYLFEMKPDGSQLLDSDVDAMNKGDGPYPYPTGGTLFSPFHSTEGNKLFKRNGYYYLQHIEFTDAGHGHGTYILRSKNIYGTKPDGTPGKPGDPGNYEILKMGDDLPGQGGFVDTPDGHWFWIAQFNRVDSDGRPPNLVPATWINDWPVAGAEIKEMKGKFAWQLPKPISGGKPMLPQGSDEFESSTLNPQWQWNYQPRADKWSLIERPGFLRLHAFKSLQPGNFFKIGNVICQRYLRSNLTVATVKIDLSGMGDGQEAGLAHFNGGKDYSTLGVVQKNGARSIQYAEEKKIIPGVELPKGNPLIWLRSSTGFDEMTTYSYSLNGITFTPFGESYQSRCAGYRGDLVGIFTVNDLSDSGVVDVDFFHYDIKNR